MDSINEARRSTAQYFLEGLTEIGCDYIFCNFGTDHAPIIEAMAAFKRDGRKAPKTVICPHEITAAHMAAGYSLATGRGQGVMVHVDSGTANSAMALHNICRARIPVLLMAGTRALHHARRAFGDARHLRALHPGAVRPGGAGPALHQMGIQPALGRGRQGGAAPGPHGDDERPQGAGLHDLPARDADRALVRGPDPLLSRGAFSRGTRGRRRSPVGRCHRDQAAGCRAAPSDHGLFGPQCRRGRAARRAGAVCRHPRRRIQSRSSQPAARFSLPWRVRADQGAGRRRCRPAGRCRCAVDPQGHAGESLDLVGACRCRPGEAGDPDVDLPGEPAPAGRQLRLLCRPARRAEGQGRCRLQGAGGGAREGDRGRGRWRVASRRPGSPPSPASPARSTRIIFAPSWPRRSVRPAW